MKIKLLILSFILTSIILSACSFSPYSYTYPKEYSAEYCCAQYELIDPNLAYTECYEFVSKKNFGLNPSVNFSAIKDCEDLSFMVYYKTAWLLGTSFSIQIVRNKDSNVNPSTDFTPLRAELFWYNESWADPNDTADADKYYCYDSQCLSQATISIASKEAIDEIMNVAIKETVLLYDSFVQEQDETKYKSKLQGIYTEDGALYVKVYFAECDGLVLVGKIMTDENNDSYMQHKVYYCHEYENVSDVTKLKTSVVTDGSKWSFYYRLGENMDALVQQAMANLRRKALGLSAFSFLGCFGATAANYFNVCRLPCRQ